MPRAVFHTRQINNELQKLFVCAGAELREEKGSPVEGRNIFFWQYLKEYEPKLSKYLGWQHQYDQTMLYVSERSATFGTVASISASFGRPGYAGRAVVCKTATIVQFRVKSGEWGSAPNL